MPKDEYTHLSNDELAVLRDAAVRLTTLGEPLLTAGRLPANDWQMPLDALEWLAYKLGVACEARGLVAPEVI
jgi:hypothetical protein